jgi:Cu/Ag efflux pump CusA
LEVVIHVDKDDPRKQFEQIQLIAAVQRKIHALDEPVATMSAINLCPPLPRSHSVRGIVGRKVIGSPRTKQRLTDANYLRETADEYLWRISVRAPAVGDLDYGFFAEKIRGAVEPLLSQEGVKGTYTGIIPLIYKAQRQLLQDLFRSFLVAFAVIAVVLVFVLRSIVAALLSMIPNVFPAVIIFGGIEWAGIPVQIGSVMTASAALGIAVDDTVHVLTWFRRGLDRGLSRPEAIRDAFGRCSGAMVHTTLICACGLLVFALSTFVPILHFAWLMVFLLLSALVGDLLLLPAILAGPAGRWFERASSTKVG